MEFKKYKLRELANVDISSVDKKTKEGEIPVKLCNFTDVYKNWAIRSHMCSSFMKATAKQKDIDKFSIHKGQVAITKDSETRDDIGIPTYIADDFDDVVLGYHCALITPHEDFSGAYLNAYLNTKMAKKYFEGYASGSGQRYTLTLDSINDIQIWTPEKKEDQERIVKVLNDIDQKIILNTRMNAKLESMAKQLYDYWFVQFDFPDENGKPYKSSGGKMVWNEKLKREIPEGWEVKNLFHIAKFTNGIACQKYRPIDENKLPVIKIKEMHDGFGSDTEYTTTNISESVKVYNKDVLFSWSASLEVMLWSLGVGALNQHIFKVTSNNGYPKSFYYYQLLEYVEVFKKIAESRKTTMGHITQDHLEQSTIVVPPNLKLPHLLEDKLCPIMDKIVKLNEEKIYLTNLRDSLLPMLMNGQVGVIE